MRRWRQREGFTLPEILLAVFFITIAIFGLVSVLLFALKGGNFNKDRHLAGIFAQSIMNQVVTRMETYSQVTTDQNRPLTPTEENARFLYLVEDTPVPGVPGAPSSVLKRIAVEIRWSDQHGPHTYRLETYVAPK